MTTNAPSPTDLLTVSEAAMILRVSAPTVRRKVAQGDLKAFHVGGEHTSLRIPRWALDDLLQKVNAS